jgi:DNA-binding NarL/FixJ family response regulator
MHKVILADGQAIFRAGIAKVLAVEDDLRVVGQPTSAEQLMGLVVQHPGAVLILASGFYPQTEHVFQQAQKARTRVIVLAENNQEAAAMLKLGAAGVIYRSISGPLLVECVRKVAAGETCVQDRVASSPLEAETDAVGARVRDRLTPKELRIVALVVQGHKNKEIADQLGTTEQVIKNYLRNVYDKIGVSDRLELALFTIHHRILAEAAANAAGRTPA